MMSAQWTQKEAHIMTNRPNFISPIILALGILGAGVSLSNAISNFRDFDRYVEVKGLDEEIVKSDYATWQINFTVSNDDIKQIYDNISTAQNTITKFLLDQGFKANEIQKQQASITDKLTQIYAQHTTNQPRYSANAGIIIATNNVDLVSEAAQKTVQLIQSGVIINNNTVRYSYTNINSIKVDMLNKATENARNAAQSFAKNSHSQLGKIKNANQGQFSISPAYGSDSYDAGGSIMKKVRVVTSVQFFIK